jgi:hypothetical protein
VVRVRKRALQKPRKRGFRVQIDLPVVARAVGVEHVLEQSGFHMDLEDRIDGRAS